MYDVVFYLLCAVGIYIVSLILDDLVKPNPGEDEDEF